MGRDSELFHHVFIQFKTQARAVRHFDKTVCINLYRWCQQFGDDRRIRKCDRGFEIRHVRQHRSEMDFCRHSDDMAPRMRDANQSPAISCFRNPRYLSNSA